MWLKIHRKAQLERRGRMLIGQFRVSLTNANDRQTLVELISELRKQLRDERPKKPTATGMEIVQLSGGMAARRRHLRQLAHSKH